MLLTSSTAVVAGAEAEFVGSTKTGGAGAETKTKLLSAGVDAICMGVVLAVGWLGGGVETDCAAKLSKASSKPM